MKNNEKLKRHSYRYSKKVISRYTARSSTFKLIIVGCEYRGVSRVPHNHILYSDTVDRDRQTVILDRDRHSREREPIGRLKLIYLIS
jgi:hypothetical protein